MNYLDNDMDDLFRRAAEGYPLKTNTADWNAIVARIDGIEPPAPKPHVGFRFGWLFLLALGILVAKPLNRTVFHSAGTSIFDGNPGQRRVTFAVPVTGRLQKQSVTAVVSPTTVRSPLHGSLSRVSLRKGDYHSTTHPQEMTFNGIRSGAALQKTTIQSPLSDNKEENPIAPHRAVLSLPVHATAAVHFGMLINGATATRVAGEYPLANDAPVSVRNPSGARRFYAGIVGGAGISNVKERWAGRPDIGAGILAGYRISKKVRVEAGLLLDKKYYSSEGQYMNTSKLSLPPNTKVEDVKGNCSMFELPLSVTFDFASTATRRWYAGAGISSYLMKNEDYKYIYFYGSTGQRAEHSRSYTNSTQNWLSVFQLSAGYVKALGKTIDLRVEPYVKIPVKGLGIGQLPVLSTGIQVGITKDLF
jgi:hypothetical protein